jgi:ABC-type sulfate/molybdate transport systems ATPase subunit
VTTIFVTHDRADVRALADRVAVLCEGIMVNLGTVEETIDR